MKSHMGAIAFAVLTLVAPVSAQAQTFEEVRGGILAQSCCGQGSNKEGGVGLNAEIVLTSPDILSILGSPKPIFGATIATDGDATSQFYGAFEWDINLSPKFFFAAGAGGAVHTGETDDFDPIADAARVDDTLFLGCRVQFRIHGNLGYRLNERFNLLGTWSHMSNAGLCNENEGLDHLGLRLGYKF